MPSTYIRRVHLTTPDGILPWSWVYTLEYDSLLGMAYDTGYLVRIDNEHVEPGFSIITMHYTDKDGSDYIDNLLENTPQRASRTNYENIHGIIRETVYLGPDDSPQ